MNTPQKEKKISLNVLDGRTELVEADLQSAITFFSKWGRELFIVILFGAVIFYGVQTYQNAQLQTIKDSSERLSRVSSAYGVLIETLKEPESTDPAKKDKEPKEKRIATLRSNLEENIKVLKDAKPPYLAFAQLYSVLLMNIDGDIEGIKRVLPSIAINDATILSSKEGLALELTALTVARGLLDTDATKGDAITLLKNLIAKGEVSAPGAAHTLATVAKTDEEKGEASSQIKKLLERKPELGSYLEKDLNRLATS